MQDILENEKNKKTTLTEYFQMNLNDPEAHHYLYTDFPQGYTWNKTSRSWKKRKSGGAVGRMYMVPPSQGEKYYLRLLLTKVRGATSFEHLKTVDNVLCETFKQSALMRGFLEDDNHHMSCMHEATQLHMPCQLRELFGVLLLFGDVSNVRSLWDENFEAMAEDFTQNGVYDHTLKVQQVLKAINLFLVRQGRKVSDYDLPLLDETVNVYDLP